MENLFLKLNAKGYIMNIFKIKKAQSFCILICFITCFSCDSSKKGDNKENFQSTSQNVNVASDVNEPNVQNTDQSSELAAAQEENAPKAAERDSCINNDTDTTFTDARDCKVYKFVKIGDQVWMAENLNFATASGSWCYNNSPDSCAKYGRLYDWNTAMSACPAGWRLPDTADLTALMTAIGEETGATMVATAGTKLKSKTGWNTESGYIAGTDEYGFSALPGGHRDGVGRFWEVGNHGNWWIATKSDCCDASNYAYYWDMRYYNKQVFWYWDHYKDFGLSVRCVRDD